MDKRGDLLESGTYENNYYGTPKPPADPSHTMQPAYSRTSANFGYGPREPLIPIDSSGSTQVGVHVHVHYTVHVHVHVLYAVHVHVDDGLGIILYNRGICMGMKVSAIH